MDVKLEIMETRIFENFYKINHLIVHWRMLVKNSKGAANFAGALWSG